MATLATHDSGTSEPAAGGRVKAEVVTTGRLRAMSPYGAFVYNILTMGLIFPWVFLWGPWAFPAGHLPTAILIATALELPLALCYVWLATSMPRSGGDYLFQSRVLGGGIAFTVVFSGLVIWSLQWVALSGWLMAVLGIAPAFLALGVIWDNGTLVAAGLAVQSPTGIVATTIVFSLIAAVLLTRGFKKFVRLQYWLFYSTMLALVALLVQFVTGDPGTFAAGADRAALAIDGTRDYYAGVIAQAGGAGANLTPAFSWLATLAIAPIAWTSLQWASYSVEQGGEIEGAANFRNQAFIIVGSLVVTGLVLAFLAWALERAVGEEFLLAASSLYYSNGGASAGVIEPFPSVLAMIMTSSPLIVLAIGLGFVANSFQIFCNVYIGTARNIVAMSMDGLLPKRLGRVSHRWHSPASAYYAYFFASIVWILAYNYAPGWRGYTLGVTFASGYVFALSGLAAALLPRKAGRIYGQSAGSRYKVAGMPLVTILGVLGATLAGVMVLAMAFHPGYGLTGLVPRVLIVGVIALSAGWYLLVRRRAGSATTAIRGPSEGPRTGS